MAWRSRGKGDLPLVGGACAHLLPETPKKRLAGKSNCRYHNSADWRGKGNLQQLPAAFDAFRLTPVGLAPEWMNWRNLAGLPRLWGVWVTKSAWSKTVRSPPVAFLGGFWDNSG